MHLGSVIEDDANLEFEISKTERSVEAREIWIKLSYIAARKRRCELEKDIDGIKLLTIKANRLLHRLRELVRERKIRDILDGEILPLSDHHVEEFEREEHDVSFHEVKTYFKEKNESLRKILRLREI